LLSFKKSIELNQKNYKAWIHKGLAELLMNKYPEAIESFRTAIGMNSKNVQALQLRAYAELKIFRSKEAFCTSTEILQSDQKN